MEQPVNKKTEEGFVTIEASPEEQALLHQHRLVEEKRKSIAEQIDKILTENNASLGIGPNSSYWNPEIVVNLNR